jgi:hypothetical protein
LVSPLDLDVGVKFIAFSGEELGLLGSKHYVEHLSEEDSVIAVINFDMVGYVDEVPTLQVVYDHKSRWMSDRLEETGMALGLEAEMEPIDLSGIANSDHASFWSAGIPANMLIEELGESAIGTGGPVNPNYHTVNDTVGSLDMGLVAEATGLVVGFFSRFAPVPEDSLPDIVLTGGSIEWMWEGRPLRRPLVAGDSVTAILRALNQGSSMGQEQIYDFQVWHGPRNAGILIHESTHGLNLPGGAYSTLEASWRTDPADYGALPFTFSLLPVNAEAEDDTVNNSTLVALEIVPQTAMINNLRVTPNPVQDASEAKIRFEILHPEGDFYGSMEIWIYDVLGDNIGYVSLAKTPGQREIDVGENSVSLTDVLRSRPAPGLYICNTRLRLVDESDPDRATFKFAVDR